MHAQTRSRFYNVYVFVCVVRVCRLCLYKMAKRQLTRNIFRSLYSVSLCFDSCRWFGDWWIYLWLCVQPLNWQRTLPLAPIDSEQQSRLYSHCHVRRTTHSPSRRWKTQQRQRTLEIIEQTKSQFIMRLLKTHNFLFRHSRKTTNRSDVNVAMEREISYPYAAFGGNPWKW